MSPSLSAMGCTQTSPTIMPHNRIPIERIYVNSVHPAVPTLPPVVTIIAPPVPAYVKSALKKPHPYGRGRPEPLAMLRPMPVARTRSVNFKETVTVKPRTPTPDKVWYEKASSTMPMRKHPRNDNDDYDYDEEETASLSSDEEPTDYTPDQSNTLTPRSVSLHHRSRSNNMREHDYASAIAPQAPSNLDTYATNRSSASPASRIKVRRKLPDPDPPQVVPSHLYQLPPQSTGQRLTTSTYPVPPQTSTQQITIPRFRTPVISPYYPSIHHPIGQASTTSSQPVTVQHPSLAPTNSLHQPPTLSTSTVLPNQSSIQLPTSSSHSATTVYSSVPPIQNAVASSNASLGHLSSVPLTSLSQVK